jgi:hypothetical protein
MTVVILTWSEPALRIHYQKDRGKKMAVHIICSVDEQQVVKSSEQMVTWCVSLAEEAPPCTQQQAAIIPLDSWVLFISSFSTFLVTLINFIFMDKVKYIGPTL